ncbi:uncharacterized protein PODANS_6_6615 [Podospora anserina S mat+]|uniref:Podospora anserina S mat+ genomic DNA chromosome 6, supercontig 2 n=1 Tax=Podospora anserina (strain S / ATCC MYA-4624 / DSM 980 / FGSC 10383) TaxID=515849 RepID=B2B3L8_PODAN|nr:uncharacterized protein PODANS_6_6615 [Podospora anserina S mat+]CAP71704.1 unnamed protein product [Podospora anserina S mat+]CDP31095.1 Putative protein of unknown function [Podospora anserina S mat+]
MAFMLTNSPYLLSQISLASFVPHLTQPHQDAKRPYHPVPESAFTTQPDALFSAELDASSKTFLDVLATKFASFSVSYSKSTVLRILADTGKIYSLNNPDELFQSIVFGPETGGEMQRWLENCRVRRLSPQFITGFRTFENATVEREEGGSGVGVQGGVAMPVGAVGGDLLGLTDVEVKGGREVKKGVRTRVMNEGERIYAIAYRKVKIREFWGGSARPELGVSNRWKAVVEGVGGRVGEEEEGEREVYLGAGLAEGTGQGAEALFEAKSVDGERVVFGWACESDVSSDEDDSDS